MTLKITIDMDNEAFSHGPLREAKRIINEALREFSVKHGDAVLHDINGNAVGKIEVIE